MKKAKNKMKCSEVFFVVFHKKAILKSLNLVLKYSGINLDLATRRKVEQELLYPIKSKIERFKRNKKK